MQEKLALLRILPDFADSCKPDIAQAENRPLEKLHVEELARLHFLDILVSSDEL